MKTLTKQVFSDKSYTRFFGIALAAIGAAVLAPASEAQAGEEDQCVAFVQGNIPWNYDGAAGWATTNVERLCAGTTRAAEPGRCFDRVMHGGVSWGGGTRWNWRNALNLCEGTDDANARVDCFSDKIAAGVGWPKAIEQCKNELVVVGLPVGGVVLGGPAAESACFDFVQGNIPWNYEGRSTWSPTNVKRLCSGATRAAEPGRCFDRVMHGGVDYGGGTTWNWKNAVNLCAGTPDATATVSCFSDKIAGGTAWPAAISQCKS